MMSFEPDKIEVHLDGTRLQPEPGQTVIPHGIDRDLTTDEVGAEQAAMTDPAAAAADAPDRQPDCRCCCR